MSSVSSYPSKNDWYYNILVIRLTLFHSGLRGRFDCIRLGTILYRGHFKPK